MVCSSPSVRAQQIAFVTKSFSTDQIGGGETLVREFCRILAEHHFDVEVLTTTADPTQLRWNEYPAGTCSVDGVTLWRFPVWQGRDAARHAQLGTKLGSRIAHTPTEEYEYFYHGLHSPALYEHLERNGRKYQAVIVLDYFVGLSHYAAAANSGRTIVYPQLHREPLAYLLPVRRFLNSVHGIMFNCPPEEDFARWELGITNPNAAIVGVGVQTDQIGRGNRFRRKFGITSPFLLYVGRLEATKNVLDLIRYFENFKLRSAGDLSLVVIGTGSLNLPHHPSVIQLGYCSEEDKFDAYAAALALVQPSLLESLSIVVLEALAQGTPVLVHGANDVTRYHCLAGNCGLYYYGREDFAAAVDYLYDHPTIRQELGRNGRAYVLENYHWDKVTARLLAALDRFTA
jgi:glycosyltransferase involved in cell wall biosynthesis